MDRLAKILSTLKHLDLDGDIEQKESVQAGFGGTCDVFMAWSKKYNSKVAIKRIRVFLRKDEKFAKKLAKEIRIWALLNHECVLPFLGYFVEGKDAMPSLVSLWMANGTLDDFMENYPRGGEDTRAMLEWIANGLSYLHSQQVIHADLKSKNILVSQDRKPLLADFGLSSALTFTKSGTTTTMASGTVRWMAIELFDDELPMHTSATDVWAFGMVAYELLSGDIPYSNKADHRVPSLILEGKVPDKPKNVHQSTFFDPLWEMCISCWNKNPEERPSAAKLHEVLTATMKNGSGSTTSSTIETAPEPAPGVNADASDLNDGSVVSANTPANVPPSPPLAIPYEPSVPWSLPSDILAGLDALRPLLQSPSQGNSSKKTSVLSEREQRKLARETQMGRANKMPTALTASDTSLLPINPQGPLGGGPNDSARLEANSTRPVFIDPTTGGMLFPHQFDAMKDDNPNGSKKANILSEREERKLLREMQMRRANKEAGAVTASYGTPPSSLAQEMEYQKSGVMPGTAPSPPVRVLLPSPSNSRPPSGPKNRSDDLTGSEPSPKTTTSAEHNSGKGPRKNTVISEREQRKLAREMLEQELARERVARLTALAGTSSSPSPTSPMASILGNPPNLLTGLRLSPKTTTPAEHNSGKGPRKNTVIDEREQRKLAREIQMEQGRADKETAALASPAATVDTSSSLPPTTPPIRAGHLNVRREREQRKLAREMQEFRDTLRQ